MGGSTSARAFVVAVAVLHVRESLLGHRPIMLLAADPIAFADALDRALGGCGKALAGLGGRAADGPGFALCSVTLTKALQKIIHRFNDLAKWEEFLCWPLYRSPGGKSRAAS